MQGYLSNLGDFLTHKEKCPGAEEFKTIIANLVWLQNDGESGERYQAYMEEAHLLFLDLPEFVRKEIKRELEKALIDEEYVQKLIEEVLKGQPVGKSVLACYEPTAKIQQIRDFIHVIEEKPGVDPLTLNWKIIAEVIPRLSYLGVSQEKFLEVCNNNETYLNFSLPIKQYVDNKSCIEGGREGLSLRYPNFKGGAVEFLKNRQEFLASRIVLMEPIEEVEESLCSLERSESSDSLSEIELADLSDEEEEDSGSEEGDSTVSS